jgi:hypothetical protein
MAITLALGLAVSALAHHSLAEYDQTTIVTIKGTIAEIKWLNPHASIVMDVKNPDGSIRRIQVEIAPPHALKLKGHRYDLVQGRRRRNVRCMDAEKHRNNQRSFHGSSADSCRWP